MEKRFQITFRQCIRFAVLVCLLVTLIGIPAGRTASAADTGKYFYTVITGSDANYTDMVGGTPVVLGDGTLSSAIPLGFTFNFFDVPYTAIYICSNGALQFPTDPQNPSSPSTCSPTASSIFSAGNPDPMIAVWWGDINPTIPGGTVQYQQSGTSPNRTLTVEFKNVSHFNVKSGTTPIDLVNFQIVLHETTDVIEVYYRDAPASDRGSGIPNAFIYHTAGIEQSATVGLQYYYGQVALSTPVMVRYQQDTTAPDTSITSTLPDDPTKLTSASFSFTGTDDRDGVTFRCQLDAQTPEDNCVSPWSHTGLSDGSHTFTVTAIDAVGNLDPTPPSHTWVIDATGPVITVIEKPALATNNTTATFTFSAQDAHLPVTFQCKYGANPWEDCASPQSFGPLDDDLYTFQISAADSLGNVTTDPAYTWKVDTKAPAVPVLISPINNAYTGNPATLKWYASADVGGGNATTYQIVVDGGAPQTVNNALQLVVSGLSSGQHTWKAAAQDAAGNVSAYSSPATFTMLAQSFYLPIIHR